MNDGKEERRTLLLVDDEPVNLQVLRHGLQAQYRLLFAKDGPTALAVAQRERPDLILLDVMLPGMSGHEVCETLKRGSDTHAIPVIYVTALGQAEDELRGLELGAVDYIAKPFDLSVVRARIRTHLSLVRAEELLETSLRLVRALGAAAEYRDNGTGRHVVRMSHYSWRLACEAGYSEDAARELQNAAVMHDVGKIGIPDAVLLKPGRLDAMEQTIMRRHAEIGARIIGEHSSSLLSLAAEIALRHHEKWDGSGYPDGLAGEAIPRAARVIAVVDVFDALTSSRPYKPAWSVEEAVAHIRQESGRHFDPALVDAFLRCLPDILEFRARWSDEPEASASDAMP
ncbi:MAG: HD domain-containing phosphohydrolase [Castellaniella sp.]|uniref:response regulator n=1 Tax=Castellaniella sp. TaxID=1955812 RepID=UPI003A886E9F